MDEKLLEALKADGWEVLTDPNRTSEVCMWCDQTLAQHRDSGPMAKMPCGGLKRGFIAEIGSKLFSETSVGDVPAPTKDDELQRAVDFLVEFAAKHRRRDADADELCPNCDAHWPHDMRAKSAVRFERAAVVKYLRDVAATRAPTSVFQVAYRCLADEIEQGDHLK